MSVPKTFCSVGIEDIRICSEVLEVDDIIVLFNKSFCTNNGIEGPDEVSVAIGREEISSLTTNGISVHTCCVADRGEVSNDAISSREVLDIEVCCVDDKVVASVRIDGISTIEGLDVEVCCVSIDREVASLTINTVGVDIISSVACHVVVDESIGTILPNSEISATVDEVFGFDVNVTDVTLPLIGGYSVCGMTVLSDEIIESS